MILKFNYTNLQSSKSKFDLSERFKLIFNIFAVENINELTNKISNITSNVGLENSFKELNIIKKDSEYFEKYKYSKIIE